MWEFHTTSHSNAFRTAEFAKFDPVFVKMGQDEEDSVSIRPYLHLVHGQVPRYDFRDPEGLNLVQKQQPVILTGSDLVEPALQKWSIEYLAENLGDGPFSVFCNKSEPGKSNHNTFKYFDEKKVATYTGSFTPPTTREELAFDEFLVRFHSDRSKARYYLQQSLTSSVGKEVAADFVRFNWSWEMSHQKEWGWGPLTSNLLLIGQAGNVTPCHYDEQQNLFCQLRGTKRFLLFSPDNFPNLYPYPVYHPHDRQSQIDLDAPYDEEMAAKFPRFSSASAVDALLSPGDILYIPMYWWHHVVNLSDTVGFNFWHKGSGVGVGGAKIEYPLAAHQKVAMVRNVEKMMLEALKDQNELATVLHWIVDGRF